MRQELNDKWHVKYVALHLEIPLLLLVLAWTGVD